MGDSARLSCLTRWDVLMKRPLFEATSGELAAWMGERGYPAYRAKQVDAWAYRRRAEQFGAMTDLPKGLREAIDAEWSVFTTEVVERRVAPDGTDKYLLSCGDGRRIECVLMADEDRRTACISTQVGCGMGCVFCASGLKGVERNLSQGEIVEQVVRLNNAAMGEGGRLTNVVVMGMGESLANFDNLVGALDRICSPGGLGLGQRRVTISTVGLPEKIRKLADLDRQYHLAVSLHAPTEALRNELVPVNAKIGLGAVIEAADEYFRKSGRRVTFEYVMLSGINDRAEDAAALGSLLEGRKAHINLIPYNPVPGLPYGRPSPSAIRDFAEIVGSWRVNVTVRKTRGREIDAACGQLRRRSESKPAATDPVAVPTAG